jgi:Tol biopolymer transport system component/DNA-binding winged helix-turn-helix (wHTH) protein
MSQQLLHVYEFGPFRMDAAEHLLLRSGDVVPLTPKAFDLLLALVEEHGHLLEKDELLKKVWPDTFVEEANLASNISQLRKVLGDGENGQRYIETAPKRGYRFVASVKEVTQKRAEPTIQEFPGLQSTVAEGEQAANVGDRIPAHPAVKAESLVSKARHYLRRALPALTALVLSGGIPAYFVLRSSLPPNVTASTQITRDGLPKVSFRGSLVTDGSRLYFSERASGQWGIAQVSVTGGETVAIHAPPLARAVVTDLSPNRSELLVLSNMGSDLESRLWVLPVLSDVPRRVGDVMSHDATWSLDGQQIVYANGSALYLAKSDGTESRMLVTVSGRPYWPRWSPDGSRLRFTVRNAEVGSLNPLWGNSLWEVSADGSNSHPLLPGWNKPANECCGNWTVDGRYFVFQSTRNGATNIWARREQAGLFRRASQEPVQLTVGPMNYRAPVPSQDGKRLFVIGELRRGELARYDPKTNQWGSYLSGISAQHLDFSRDGAWVVYVTYPESNLWRSKIDGSQRLQLTSPPMQADLPRWSPDGKQIAFTARVPGKGWKIYLISAEGGTPQQLMPEDNEEDPSWSPDGKTLVFADRDAKTIRLFDLSTRQVSRLPGSEGLQSPRWSPDGRYIAAIPFGSQHKLLLFDFTTQKWTELVPQPAAWQRWSRDGKYIYFDSQLPNDPALFRVRIGDRKIDRIASTKNFRPASDMFFGTWFGWAPDDSPLVLRDLGTQDIYALEWQTP